MTSDPKTSADPKVSAWKLRVSIFELRRRALLCGFCGVESFELSKSLQDDPWKKDVSGNARALDSSRRSGAVILIITGLWLYAAFR
jgi:hypothetical protein